MNYSARAKIINILFIALIFFAPISYCLYETSIPPEICRTVIIMSFALAAFVIMDWYHFYSSNSFRGAVGAITLGVAMAIISLLAAATFSDSSIAELATFERVEAWGNQSWLLRGHVAGIGVSTAAIVGIGRLLAITSIGEIDLHAPSDT
jgi:hypothetical protein